MDELTPRAIVKELDRYIVGQKEAKVALAVALRNRWRRRALPPEMAREVTPKNLLLIGPTGVGKTEMARRMARLAGAPFIKVEATKFTEVGYVGRDVESMIQDLVEGATLEAYETRLREVQDQAETLAAERILDCLCPPPRTQRGRAKSKAAPGPSGPAVSAAAPARGGADRAATAELLRNQQLEDQVIEIELGADWPAWAMSMEMAGTPEEETYPQPSRSRNVRRRVPVREARRLLAREEANKLVDWEEIIERALRQVEEEGVVFLDELDKIAGPRVEMGPDVSGEGVQRDLLPLVEGTTVMTRFGPVRTDYSLFGGAGTFHRSKPSDMIPELQGRFPLRVEVASLTQTDLERILTEPENALTKQYHALLATEGVELVFTLDGIAEMSRLAALMNERLENIGARRLHTIMEKVLEEVSFTSPERAGERVMVDAALVRERLASLIVDEDLSRYIL